MSPKKELCITLFLLGINVPFVIAQFIKRDVAMCAMHIFVVVSMAFLAMRQIKSARKKQ